MIPYKVYMFIWLYAKVWATLIKLHILLILKVKRNTCHSSTLSLIKAKQKQNSPYTFSLFDCFSILLWQYIKAFLLIKW